MADRRVEGKDGCGENKRQGTDFFLTHLNHNYAVTGQYGDLVVSKEGVKA